MLALDNPQPLSARMKQLTRAQTSESSSLERQAQPLSPHTVADYPNAFRKLQAYLGAPVQTYLSLAQTDLDAAHRKASPGEHGRL